MRMKKRKIVMCISFMLLMLTVITTGCKSSKEKYLDTLKGSYQAREEGLVGSTKYTGYWHLDLSRSRFSIYDNEAGNPGVSGSIEAIDSKYLTVKVDMDATEDIPVGWKIASGKLKLKYKKSGKVLKLTNNKKTLVMEQR